MRWGPVGTGWDVKMVLKGSGLKYLVFALLCTLAYQGCGNAFTAKQKLNASALYSIVDDTTEKIAPAPPARSLTNEEYLQVASDLIGKPVPRSVIAGWSPSPVANDFDTVGSAYFDQKTTQDRLAAAEQIASIAITSPKVITCEPAIGDASWSACAQKIATDFATRAFRRPLTQADIASLQRTYVSVATAAANAYNSTIEGYLDSAGANLGVNGWALDTNWPERTVEIHFYVDGEYAGNTITNQNRADVNAAKNVTGDHGFAYRLPAKWADGKEHTVRAYAIGGPGAGNPELSNSGRKFTSSGGGGPIGGSPYSTAFTEGMKAVIESVLASPHFLLKVELPEFRAGVATTELSDYELASRLSFLITGSVPDAELWKLASEGKLKDQWVLREQARRLLDTYSDRFAMSFAGQWAGFRRYATKYANATPMNSTEQLEQLFAEESKLVFKELIDKNADIEEILDPGFTYVNPLLADHYGIPRPATAGFGRVATYERGGLLEQGSILRLTSNPASTHPIRRGRWVLGSLLCEALPLADASLREEIDKVSKEIPHDLSVGERLIRHRSAGAACMGCHAKMDPIGLGLENYDPLGRWRTTYEDGKPVLSSSDIYGIKFGDGRELSQILKKRDDFRRCMVKKAVTFVLSRTLTTEDEALIRNSMGDREGIKGLIIDLVSSESFRTVRKPSEAP